MSFRTWTRGRILVGAADNVCFVLIPLIFSGLLTTLFYHRLSAKSNIDTQASLQVISMCPWCVLWDCGWVEGHYNTLYGWSANSRLNCRQYLLISLTDTLISPTSTAPYTVDKLEKMLKLANSLKGKISCIFLQVDLPLMSFAYLSTCGVSLWWISTYFGWVGILMWSEPLLTSGLHTGRLMFIFGMWTSPMKGIGGQVVDDKLSSPKVL